MKFDLMKKVIVVGGGPAGLMAAEVLSASNVEVHLYDAMPSVGRKFLLAGKGGLNLTHSEPIDIFSTRYGGRKDQINALLAGFSGSHVRDWARGLGVETYVGSSGRVFPVDMKAAPLLRAWLHRLRHPSKGLAVEFHMRHRWIGWNLDAHNNASLNFQTPDGLLNVQADAVVLALGGGSWARLGSNGAWVAWLKARGVAVAPLLPANCGFDVHQGWSDYFSKQFAGRPFKSVAIHFKTTNGVGFHRKGEFVATQSGLEGSLIYAASSLLRDEILQNGEVVMYLDLLPEMSEDKVMTEVTHPRGSRSLSSHLKSRLGIDGIKAAILHEFLSKDQINNPVLLAKSIKAIPLKLRAARPIDEAISTAGGVAFEGVDSNQMLQILPSVFCAGEMLDWEAPTGGYLLTACLASGKRAGEGVVQYLDALG